MKALLIALAGLAAARTTQPQEGVPHKLEPLFAPLVSDGSDRTERSAQGGCFGCSGKTSGPCKSADGACWAYQDVWGVRLITALQVLQVERLYIALQRRRFVPRRM